jgi:hypothetical protein
MMVVWCVYSLGLADHHIKGKQTGAGVVDVPVATRFIPRTTHMYLAHASSIAGATACIAARG